MIFNSSKKKLIQKEITNGKVPRNKKLQNNKKMTSGQHAATTPKLSNKMLTSNIQAHTLMTRCLQGVYNHLSPKDKTKITGKIHLMKIS